MPFPLTPFDSSLSIASPNAPPRTDHQAMPFPHNGPTSEPNKYKSTRTSPTTDRSCLSTPFDSSVSNASQMHLRRQTIFGDVPNVSLHVSMVLPFFPRFYSILPLFYWFFLWCYSIFPWFCSTFLGFCSIFAWFSFIRFSMVYPIFKWFCSIFPWFFHGFTRLLHNFTLPFRSPQIHLGGWKGGIDTPPSPNCHLVHKPSKSSNLHPSHCT